MTKYIITASAHNERFFTNPDRVVFKANQAENIDDWAFARICENKAQELTGINAPFEMVFKEV